MKAFKTFAHRNCLTKSGFISEIGVEVNKIVNRVNLFFRCRHGVFRKLEGRRSVFPDWFSHWTRILQQRGKIQMLCKFFNATVSGFHLSRPMGDSFNYSE